jgi:DNA alkylation damage repair protein AlkB
MILLKSYISFNDQIEIVNKCRDLGRSSGGFYEPGYREGGRLHLKMMCLGKNWDPDTGEYGDQRPSDGAKPPSIPYEFCQLVKGAIQASHSFLREHHKVPIVEHVLPTVSPNICIVNFYSHSGKLGLHQDKDESQESLNRGLPVVSFSIGESAEFLYNDHRDTESAKKVILESGDVLIFGGESRRIFHGVTTISPGTAPTALLEETHLRPGRLNLTFREY